MSLMYRSSRLSRTLSYPSQLLNKRFSRCFSTEEKCPRHQWRGNLKEFSVVYTDRAVNLMSSPFQQTMKDISSTLKSVYNTDACILIPGSGTYGMEAVARQLGTDKKCMVLRNGFFSYRWSDIFKQCHIPSEQVILKASPTTQGTKSPYAPPSIDYVVDQIKKEKPAVVFAPHVETSTGIILPDSYITAVAEATHEVGGTFVLDCIASGTVWVDMAKTGVDVLITAPQKGWSGPASVGIVMANEATKAKIAETESTSMVLNLKKWLEVMTKYEEGAFMYYTTLPTDSLSMFCAAMNETKNYGIEKANQDIWTLGSKIRNVLEEQGYPSAAAEGFQAPGVVVSYADDLNKVAEFKQQGLQIAAGVPWFLDEPEGTGPHTFRLGLFGLDKIANIDQTVSIFEEALTNIPK